MFSASAEFYDLIYATLKDYASETAQIAGLLEKLNPQCKSVLDVACGTGEHARLLAARGFIADGIDLDPSFLSIAEQKHPAGRFFAADMSDFQLAQRYDAVLCLFSSIGYLQTLARVRRAFTCFRDHLTADGVIVVEPWFPPGVLDAGRMTRQTAEAKGIRVSRTSRLAIQGSISRLHFDYEISDSNGIRHASEVHELGLFTQAELLRTFQEAGLQADHDPKGLTDRGLYVARIPR